MDINSLGKPKNFPTWTGYQVDQSHYVHQVMLHSGPEKVTQVLEHVFQKDIIKTKIRIRDPQDGRKWIEPMATVQVLRIKNRPEGCTLGVNGK